MVGSSAPKGMTRLLVEAAPALRRRFKSPATRHVPPSCSHTTSPHVHDEHRKSEKFWRMVFVVGSIAFVCRVAKVFKDKHADIRRACEENELAWAQLREKDEQIRKLQEAWAQYEKDQQIKKLEHNTVQTNLVEDV
ncbi:unnamed protein product [Urochloa humidicola]